MGNGKFKRLGAKLLLVLGGLVFGCVVAEIVLRIAGYSYPIFYQTDPERGYAPIPNAEGWFWIENKTYLRYNSDGFRDREHAKEKPANTVRIAILGDSFAEARQVQMDDAFWAVMERKLNECNAFPGKSVEVINFGVGGYGTVGQLQTLRQKVWQYSPDIVLLAFTTYNDVVDNYRPLKATEEIPYYSLVNGELVYDDAFLSSAKYRWLDSATFGAWVSLHNHSRFIQLVHHAQFALRTKTSTMREARRLAEVQKQHDSTPAEQRPRTGAQLQDLVGVQNMIYVEPGNDDWRNAWALTEALIAKLRDEVEQREARFMLTTITTDIQVYPDPAVRKARMDQIGVSDLFYPDRRLETFAERNNIDFLDLAEPMQMAADRTGTFFHGFGSEIGNAHWNEAGHKIAGGLISDKLCRSN